MTLKEFLKNKSTTPGVKIGGGGGGGGGAWSCPQAHVIKYGCMKYITLSVSISTD